MHRVMVLDTEKNGLYGHTIAYAAYLYEDGKEVAESTARVPDTCISDTWVWQHVRPAIFDMLPILDFSGAVEETWWKFWETHRTETQLVTYCGSPFETHLVYRCVKRALSQRQNLAPLPIHDLATLMCVLEGPYMRHYEYAAKYGLTVPYKKRLHDPRYDARLTYACWSHAISRISC